MKQEDFSHEASKIRAMSIAVAQRMGYVQDDAEDIAQDTMLKLWCLHEKISDVVHMKALATITTKHMCVDRHRSKINFSSLNESILVIDDSSTHDSLEYAQLEQWMEEQIASLPSTSGIVLRMRQLEQRELSEIAGILGIKQSSVSTLLSRARNELIEKLKRRNQQ